MSGHALESNPGRDASPARLDGWLQLAAGVLVQAYSDLTAGGDELALDALEWLTTPPAALISEALDLGDPVGPVCTGRFTRARSFGGRRGERSCNTTEVCEDGWTIST